MEKELSKEQIEQLSKKIPQKIVNYAKKSLITPILLLEHEDGTLSKVVGKKRGNATYNFHSTAKTNVLNEQAVKKLKVDFNTSETNTFFVTLTTQYVPGSISSTLNAIDKVCNRLPTFQKDIKRNIGKFDYIVCKECHKMGGLHLHMIIQFKDNMFKCFKDHKGNYRSDNLRSIIKEYWNIGNIDLKGVFNDNGVFKYVTKELGKSQNVENALKRYEKNEKLKKNDSNKIWLLGATYLYKEKTGKNIRFLTYSKGYKIPQEKIEQEKQQMLEDYETALINNMTNSDNDLLYSLNEIKNKKIIRFCVLGKSFVSHIPYFYKSGIVREDTEIKRYKDILDKYGLETNQTQENCNFLTAMEYGKSEHYKRTEKLKAYRSIQCLEVCNA